MNLDERKIKDLDIRFTGATAELRKKLAVVAPSSADEVELEFGLREAGERLAALRQIMLRNGQDLRQVRKKVFVSTKLEVGGRVPEWIARLLDRVNRRKGDGELEFDFVFGTAAPGGEINLAILENLSSCYCFLSVVTADALPAGWQAHPSNDRTASSIRPYLSEEGGVAFALGKPVVIAVESPPIDPLVVGVLFGTSLQRVHIERATDREAGLADQIREALERAPRTQVQSVLARREIVARLF